VAPTCVVVVTCVRVDRCGLQCVRIYQVDLCEHLWIFPTVCFACGFFLLSVSAQRYAPKCNCEQVSQVTVSRKGDTNRKRHGTSRTMKDDVT